MTTTLRRYAFGTSGLADNVIGTFLGVHLFVYYTDVVGLSPLWVSTGLTIALVWNALADFAMGRLSDRTRTRLGRRRPFILLGALPVGAAFALLLHPPTSLTGDALGVYFTAALLLLFTAKTMVQVPALSLLPEMAEDGAERTALAAAREQMGNVGDLLGLLLPVALLIALGADAEGAPASRARDAFGLASIGIGAVASLALLVTFAGTRERAVVPASKSLGVRDALEVLRAHRPFRAVLGAAACGALALSLVQSLILYVLTHVMHETDPAMHLLAFVVNVVGAMVSYPMWTRLAAARGPATAFRTSLALSSLVFFSVFVVGPGDHAALALVMAFSGAANVGFWTMIHALNAECAEMDAARSGERREGLFMGFSALVKKLAIGGAGALVGVGLTIIGYHEGATPSSDVVLRLQVLFALPTTLLVLAALWAFRGYGATTSSAEPTALPARASFDRLAPPVPTVRGLDARFRPGPPWRALLRVFDLL
jgi:GPH family glycoside/pentoside/hexuronide:cation symporter